MKAEEAFSRFSTIQAEICMQRGQFHESLEWLEKLPEQTRPKLMEAEAYYKMSCIAVATRKINEAVEYAGRAHSQANASYLYQRKTELLRNLRSRRTSVMEDQEWESSARTIRPCVKLASDAYAPEVDEVCAVGAYYSRGRYQGNYWCKLILMQKDANEELGERIKLTESSAKYMARYLLERTNLVSEIDWVVAVPPDPERYAERHNDIPTILGKGIELSLAVPFADSALRRVSSTPDLRGLSKEERKRLLAGNMKPDKIKHLKGRNVLVVDDVTTFGTTFSEAAKTLKENGVSRVFAVALAHTEG